MAVGTLQQLTVKGIRRELQERIDAIDEWWRGHVTELNSTTEVEPFAWAGAVPQPREMLGERRIQELRTFTYNITNKEYELTVLFPRKWFEDDQTGAMRLRISEMAQAWRNYKLYLFTQMLENGGSAGYTAYDGNTFFHDTRTEGDSGAIDNNLTSVAAADDAVPTAAEFLAQMAIIKAAMRRFNDDQGLPANRDAMTQLRVIVPGEAETSQVITKLVLDIAEHDLRSLRPPVNEDVVRKRGEAIKLLEKYHDGRASLPGLLPLAAPTGGGTVAQVEGADSIFGRDKTDGF